MTFQAFRVTEYASSENGWMETREDITAEVLAMPRDPGLRMVKLNGNPMTAETRNGLKIRLNRDTDEQRAVEYMRRMTGKEFNMAIWGVCAHGLNRVRYVAIRQNAHSEWDSKRRRYVAVKPEPSEVTEIPHWDWNGHNETPIAETV